MIVLSFLSGIRPWLWRLEDTAVLQTVDIVPTPEVNIIAGE